MNEIQNMSELKRKRIVIADDDDAIADALKVMLEFEGYEVILTKDSETESVVCVTQPDIVLLDIWMAGMDGRSICANLKQNPITKHIPVLLISASRNAHMAAKECLADGFIAKPFEMSHLVEQISVYVMARNVAIKP